MGKKRDRSNAESNQAADQSNQTVKKLKPLVFRRTSIFYPATNPAATAVSSDKPNKSSKPHDYPDAAERSNAIRAMQEEIEQLLLEKQKLKNECNNWCNRYYISKGDPLGALIRMQHDIYNLAHVEARFDIKDLYPASAEMNVSSVVAINIDLPYVVTISKLQTQRDNILQENTLLKIQANILYHRFECTRLELWNLLTRIQNDIINYIPDSKAPLPMKDICHYPYPELAPTSAPDRTAGVPIFSLSHYSTHTLPISVPGSGSRSLAAAAAAPLRLQPKAPDYQNVSHRNSPRPRAPGQ